MAIAPTVHAQEGSDIFLHVQTKRAGKVKGESKVAGHVDDIVVSGWHWGLSASTAIGTAQATGRRSYTALTVRKGIDAATTPLMSALATNDEVKEARLTMRRAGGQQDDYFIITLRGARISGVEHEVEGDGSTRENVTIAFTQVEVEYRLQGASGVRGGATTFTDQLPTA